MKRLRYIVMIILVLALFAATVAMAEDTETVTTITCKPGTLLSDDILNQICDTASLRIHSLSDGYGALVLSLGEVDALTNLFRVGEDGFYVQSDLLGEKPLYFSWEELSTLMMDQLQNNPDMEGFNAMMDPTMFQAMMSGEITEDTDDETLMSMMNIDEETLNYINGLEESKTVETGTFSLEGSDTANQKSVITLEKEDLLKVFTLPMVRQQMVKQLTMESPELTEEEINAKIDAELAEIDAFITQSNLTLTVTVYTMDEDFVALEYVVSGTGEGSDGAPENETASFTVTKTTVEPGTFYQAKLHLVTGEDDYIPLDGSLYLSDEFVSGKLLVYSDPETPVVTVSFSYDQSEADHVMGEIDATLNDESTGLVTAILVFDQTKGENVTDTVLDLYFGGSLDEMKLSLPDYSVITLNLHTVTQPDSGFFASLQNATPEGSVQMTQMTDEELNTYVTGIQQSMMTTLMSIMNNLPPDISNALMESSSSL